MSSRFIPHCIAAVLLSACAQAQQPVGEVFATDATVHGSVQMSSGGTKVLSGATVTAGDAAARVKLTRGGEVRVCRGTSLVVSASPNGRELMLAIGSGAIEADYRLEASADSILTPDFKILLAGPGTFRFALRSQPNGDTCVQTRASNGASLVLSEVMGDATYQVKPNERVLFHKGHLAEAEANPPEDCGCPPPAPSEIAMPKPATETTQPVLAAATPQPVDTPPPAPDPNKVQVEVESPFVFRADDIRPIGPPPPAARESLASLPAVPVAEALPPAVASVVPPAPSPEKKKGHFSKLRAFFAAIFK